MKRLIRWLIIRLIAKYIYRKVKICKYDKHEIYLVSDRGIRITLISLDELEPEGHGHISDVVAWDGMANFITNLINDAIRYKRRLIA